MKKLGWLSLFCGCLLLSLLFVIEAQQFSQFRSSSGVPKVPRVSLGTTSCVSHLCAHSF